MVPHAQVLLQTRHLACTCMATKQPPQTHSSWVQARNTWHPSVALATCTCENHMQEPLVLPQLTTNTPPVELAVKISDSSP